MNFTQYKPKKLCSKQSRKTNNTWKQKDSDVNGKSEQDSSFNETNVIH